ncbi:hypothetical protein ACN1C3_08880 [Pseudomonas sp. H11T01]|uniref:hypothetical protein n=1 Tax=Pseudomonas sp. H11T01 TaxID=3402749 RepID=UPI003AC982A8
MGNLPVGAYDPDRLVNRFRMTGLAVIPSKDAQFALLNLHLSRLGWGNPMIFLHNTPDFLSIFI